MKERVADVFKTKTRDEWCRIMEGSDVCFAPVLSMTEATEHPHNVARGTFVEIDGLRTACTGAALQPHGAADAGPRCRSRRAYGGCARRLGLRGGRDREAP